MSPDPTNGPGAPEAELPEAPPGAEEGHDAPAPGQTRQGGRETAAPEVAAETAAPEVAAEVAADVAADEGADLASGRASEPEPAEAFAEAGAELEALTARAAQADEYLALAQRTQADFENFRRRAARDAALARERGASKLATALLPAVDNLERALAHAPEADDDGGFVAGIKHVHSDLIAALKTAGIERYSPEGEAFDPQLHEAVAQQPVEGTEPGTVVEVFQRGYRMGETVVRPARVVVAG
ncbi:MAG: nucleotide exchange factor GrpE [Solirubrobacterales bacterium]|nr:nucleotide exchange factor GrpE [Solirubrobacterales bacterium]